MSERKRQQAWEAGKDACEQGLSERSCNYQRGTILYDDWHDGYEYAARTAQTGADQ